MPTNLIRLPVDFVSRLVRRVPPIHFVVGVFVYVGLNATWSGLFAVSYRITALTAVVLLLVMWLAYRIQYRWYWHQTALDGVVGLWLLAFVVSLLANLDLWRRISLGVWFSGLYILLWYVLHDWIGNQGLKRSTLVDGLLVGGSTVLVFGYVDIYRWIFVHQAGLPRVSAHLDNPNPAATVTLVLIPLALARFFSTRGLARIIFLLYVVLSVGLLICTGSRGAWIGGGVSLALMALLLMVHYKIRINRRLVVGVVIAGAIGMVGGISFVRGWGLGRRAIIYDTAIQVFREKPLTGYGLFTFGHELIRVSGIEPGGTTYAHAHNFVLNIAAELGIVGLVALAATLAMLFLAVRRNWYAAGELDRPGERLILIGATVASIGFGVHHLVDMTAMLPAVALAGLIALVVAVAPLKPLPMRWPRFETILVGGLILLLVSAGIWEIVTFNMYESGLADAVVGRVTEAIQQLQVAENVDPAMPVTLVNLAYLQYLNGQHDAARRTFAALCRVDPDFAPYPYDKQESISQFFRFSLTTSMEFWTTFSCSAPNGNVP